MQGQTAVDQTGTQEGTKASAKRQRLAPLWAALRVVSSVFWALFCVWMLTWSMFFSALYGIAFLAVSWSSLKAKKTIVLGLLLVSPLYIWNVGLVEYGQHALALHCRALGFAGATELRSCKSHARGEHKRGRRHRSGPLLSPIERAGVHGFNLLLAAGGTLAGFPEVAWETLYLSFASDPTAQGMSAQPKDSRKRQCVGGKRVQRVDTSEDDGDFLMGSSTVRRLLARHVKRARSLPAGKCKLAHRGKLVFRGSGGGNNSYYASLLKTDNLRVPLALVVNDGELTVTACGAEQGGYLDLRWTGTISYPVKAKFELPLPTIWQLPGLRSVTGIKSPYPVYVSEGAFCAMAMDGAMNPYTQVWVTRVEVDDPRLTTKGIKESSRGWFESLVRLVL